MTNEERMQMIDSEIEALENLREIQEKLHNEEGNALERQRMFGLMHGYTMGIMSLKHVRTMLSINP